MRNLSFRWQQFAILLALTLVPLLIITGVILPSNRDIIYQRTVAQLEAVAELKSVQVQQWFDQGCEVARLVSSDRQIQSQFPRLTTIWMQDQVPSGTEADALIDIRTRLKDLTAIFANVQSISLLHPDTGKVLLSTDRRLQGRDRGKETYFQAGRQALHVSPVAYSVGREAPILTVSAPVRTPDDKLVTVVAVEMNLTDLQTTLDSRAGLGQTGRAYLVDIYGFYVTLPGDTQDSPLRTIAESQGVRRVRAGENGNGIYRDPRGVQVLGVYRWLAEGNLGLLVEIEEQELTERVRQSLTLILVTSAALFLLSLVAAYYLSHWLVSPLAKIAQAARSLSAGNLEHRVPPGGPKEIGQLSSAFNEMAEDLQYYSKNMELMVARRTRELRLAVEQLEREITERRHTEVALRESKERYRSVVEYSHAGILIVDQAYRSTYVNDELCRILGYPREEIIGRDFREFLDDESQHMVAEYYLERRRGKKVPPRYEASIIRQDGEKRHIEISATLITDTAGNVQSVGQVLDITDRKQAEDEIVRLLEQARRDAGIKASLLNEVNHRVKNNLAAILGILSLETDRTLEDGDDFRAAIEDVQNRVWGIATVHEMLSAAQWSPLPLDKLVNQIVHGALNNSPIRQKIQTSIQLPPGGLRVVSRQATALALILNELTTNSVKHAFEGREQGHIQVEVTLAAETNQIRLTFRDDGPGWPDDVLAGQRESVGLRLVRLSVRSPLRGRLDFYNDGGAVTTISFKIASP